MNMSNLGFRHVCNAEPLVYNPTRPCQVFQSGEILVIRVLLPQLATDGSVGIVTERVGLV